MRFLAAALFALCTAGHAHAEAEEPAHAPASTSSDPWKTAVALGITTTTYAGAWALLSAAWWSGGATNEHLVFRDEGLFGLETYAGGADKLGHLYSNYLATRVYTSTLAWGGFSRSTSMVAATLLTAGFFTGIELKDGYQQKYGFSWSDLGANAGGQAAALAVMLIPGLNRALSLKLLYFPSGEFLHSIGTARPHNMPEDYSGQTYLLAFHLQALPPVQRDPAFRALRYVDVSLGFATRGFAPVPRTPVPVRQILSLGLSLNLTRALEDVLGRERSDGEDALLLTSDVLQPPFTRVSAGVERRGAPVRAEE